MRITITGASGFIGKKLLKSISPEHSIKGLSRSHRESSHQVDWVKTDIFSYNSCLGALADTDIAVYLVHSMLPTSRLFQGSFEDTDLFLADNFARACKKNGVKKIIYLGGLQTKDNSSKHLESRREVEDVFMSTGIPTTVLRAGMVVGDGGSSFEILKNLVLSLPVMVLPKWTESSTQAIYIDDLIQVLMYSISSNSTDNKIINVVNGEKINYKRLIEEASSYFKGPKLLIPVPINYTSFSKLWVTFFGQADYELVSPLIDSLVCDLVEPDISSEISDLIKYKTFKLMLEQIPKNKVLRKKGNKKKTSENTVRSIQRLSNRVDLEVDEVSSLYVQWLPLEMKNLIQVKWEGDFLKFRIIGLKQPLLTLHKQSNISELKRVKFHIVGGLLTKTKDTGWLEFRKTSGDKFILASINNFIPSLPWYIYKYSQALVHLSVMKRFSKFLKTDGAKSLKSSL